MTISRWTASVLVMCCSLAVQAQTPATAKKELVQKLLQLQQPGLEAMARNLAEQPAAMMVQEASRVIQTQVAADKREAVGKNVQASAKKYMDDSVPLLRDQAIKLAPSTIGAAMEEKFSEDELKQLIAWYESPVNKKFQQALPEIQNNFVQKLVAEARPAVDPKVKALEQDIRASLTNASASSNTASGPASKPTQKPSSSKKAAPASASGAK